MLEKTSEMVGRIVDGRLSCTLFKNEDLFAFKNNKIIAIEKDLESAWEELNAQKRANILTAFRATLSEFEDTYHKKPTMILMRYYDVEMLVDSYNKEIRELTKIDGITRVEAHSYDAERCLIDGVKVKEGCDQEYGEIRIYSFE